MVKIYDTSALLNRFFYDNDEIAYITNSVISEIIDLEHRLILETKINQGFLKIQEPNKNILKKILKITQNSKLSKTDKEILALAFELKGTLVSDDFLLLRFAKKLKITTEKVLR